MGSALLEILKDFDFLLGLTTQQAGQMLWRFMTIQIHCPINSNTFFDANSNTFNYGKWEIINTNTSDTSFYKIADTVWIELPINVVAKDGFDTRIPLRLNYSILFEGISFTNDNQVLIEQKIKNNLRNAFSIQ